jgi:phage baseplate assembly protein W
MVDFEQERSLFQNKLLGWSIACEPVEGASASDSVLRLLTGATDLGRDLRLEAGPNGRDFARVRGVDNLAQSLSIALTTLFGSDLFNSQFGFDGLNALVEETNPLLARERVRAAVIAVLQRDARIRRIIDVKLEDGRLEPAGGSVLTDDAGQDERMRQARILGVRVAFETITGDQAAINLERIIPHGG